jgi:hypothetical protein
MGSPSAASGPRVDHRFTGTAMGVVVEITIDEDDADLRARPGVCLIGAPLPPPVSLPPRILSTLIGARDDGGEVTGRFEVIPAPETAAPSFVATTYPVRSSGNDIASLVVQADGRWTLQPRGAGRLGDAELTVTATGGATPDAVVEVPVFVVVVASGATT